MFNSWLTVNIHKYGTENTSTIETEFLKDQIYGNDKKKKKGHERTLVIFTLANSHDLESSNKF